MKTTRLPQIVKAGYQRNHLLDPTQIQNLGLDVQILFYKHLDEDNLKWKTSSNFQSGLSQKCLIVIVYY